MTPRVLGASVRDRCFWRIAVEDIGEPAWYSDNEDQVKILVITQRLISIEIVAWRFGRACINVNNKSRCVAIGTCHS